MQKRKIFIILAILTAIFIFYMSSLPYGEIPGKQIRQKIKIIPTIYHFGIFFLLTIFLLIGIKAKNKTIPLATIILILYAVLDELHQYFTTGRYCTFYDLIINSLGIFCATIFYFILRKTTHTHPSPPHQDSVPSPSQKQ